MEDDNIALSDLKKQMEDALSVYKEATDRYQKALCAQATFQAGDRIRRLEDKKIFEIVSLEVRYDRIRYKGKMVKKDGALGAVVNDLWFMDYKGFEKVQ